jgi:cytochrome P450
MPQTSCTAPYCISIFSVQYSSSLQLHASIPGSETTATTLTMVLYYLCHNSYLLRNVRKEILTTFKRYEDIDAVSTAKLRYQPAVCLEALRVVPPLPLGLPRVVPNGGAFVDGHFVPGGVR